MSVTLTFLGHSGFILDDGSTRVAIDPFLTGNPVAPCDAEAIECDHIVITHGHADHFGDTEAIAKRTGASVTAAYEISEYLGERGVECQPCNPGGRLATLWRTVSTRDSITSGSKGLPRT